MARKFLITLAVTGATLMAAASAQASERISVSFGFYEPAVEYVRYPAPVIYREAPPVYVRYETGWRDRDYDRRSCHHGYYEEREEHWDHWRDHDHDHGYDHDRGHHHWD
ncbi:MAG: hypothetical protein EPO06_02590 [Burkholderiaceae bacterium]|nr:MAG: hypothetical protein EPO06_02590 [Burkholderiaceae bacterium]